MRETIPEGRKKRGRPTVGSELIGVRLPPDQLALLDRWALNQRPPISRPEALRRLAAMGMQQEGMVVGFDEYIAGATGAADLYFRLDELRRGGFRPDLIGMSLDVWTRLEQESAFAITPTPNDRLFDHVSVLLIPKAEKISIAYTKTRRATSRISADRG
ncbi:hypothetical protein [Phenylobacterium sp.]|jgi:hypothetical protein|uniref:hypothetical protein n=1 Tax=Phenylobacterium sp. TaxID=1871053 RepID=UPI002E355B01|nr:hypothetical protein [Phenylobacterium sp.]HEX3366491.1 hypothetical protein [Phenylobacterium sp.]